MASDDASLRKTPIQDWEEFTVRRWLESLEVDSDTKLNLKSASFVKHISGYDLREARTVEMMMQLFSSPIYRLNITKEMAQFLYDSVQNIMSQYKQRLAMNQQRFREMNAQTMPSNTFANTYSNTRDNNNNTNINIKNDTWDTKNIKQWNTNDTLQWINTLNLTQKQQENTVNVFRRAERDGKYLLSLGSGLEIANDHIIHSRHGDINVKLGEILYKELTKLKESIKQKRKERKHYKSETIPNFHRSKSDPQHPVLPSNTESFEWKHKNAQDWTCSDLQYWIKSLHISNQTDEMKILNAIELTECTGYDFKGCRNGNDIAQSFDSKYRFTQNFCQYIYREFQSASMDKHNAHKDDMDLDLDDDDLKINISNNNEWKHKHIDEWSSDELQGWIADLPLHFDIKLKLIKAIKEERMKGSDFNGCSCAKDISDSFDAIDERIGERIYCELEKVRKSSAEWIKDDRMWLIKDKTSGMIGLTNIGNTCFINAVIQCLLQTPALTGVFRTWPKYARSMLDGFIEIAQLSMRNNAKYNSFHPKCIVNSLRNSDIKFERGQQGDALSAMFKIIELLDIDMINRHKMMRNTIINGDNHSGSWYIEGDMDEYDEEELIVTHLTRYNPYKSVIRKHMRFVERNTFYCMNAGCGWKESRYDIKQKVLLPLKDHSMDINIDIYIVAINKRIKAQVFNVLDYCSVDTLRHAIFERISSILKIKQMNGLRLESMDQITLKAIKANHNAYFKEWIQDIDMKTECKCISSVSVIALIESKLNQIYSDYGEYVLVTILDVFINDYGCVDKDLSRLRFDKVLNGDYKSFDNDRFEEYHKYVYVDDVLYDENSNLKFKITQCNNVIICLWISDNIDKIPFMKFDVNHFENQEYEIWKCIIYEKCKNFKNYRKCSRILSNLRDSTFKEYTESDESSNFFASKWMDSLNKCISYFNALHLNQTQVYTFGYDAFKYNKRNKNISDMIQNDICSAFDVYRSDKILDRGAVLKCKKCATQSAVVKVTKEIVKYPKILIFTIDRYVDGTKYNDLIKYPLKLEYNEGYQLYAVCNHSGSLRDGHYWSYVKGVDDDEWYNANDSSIRRNKQQNVVNDRNAIILMYKPIQE